MCGSKTREHENRVDELLKEVPAVRVADNHDPRLLLLPDALVPGRRAGACGVADT